MIDSITFEVLQGKLLATVDEMGIVLARASMSPVIYEVLDFACGVCDLNCELIAQSNGITLFTGTFSAQVSHIRAKYGADLLPGDLFISNDPFRGGTHGCDMAVIRPLFHGLEMIGYAIAVAHWLDVGGAVPGSLPVDATSSFEEGLRLPGVRLARDDRLQQDVLDIIRENVRLPDLATGDLSAGIAAVRIAERRLREICREYGVGSLRAAFERLLTSSADAAERAVRALPEGRWEAHDFIDGDGRSDERIPVQVAVTLANGHATFDFTGCAAARAAPINCSRAALESSVKTIFKALVAPQSPSNEGWFRPLSVVVPDGTVFSALRPSPTGWYYEASAQASELAWKALASLAPQRFSAGSYMSLCASYLSGRSADGEEWVHIEPQHGGWGATQQRDGASALIAVTDGDTFNYSVELLEAKFPLRVVSYRLNTSDGSGAGRFRGGYGTVREYEIMSDDTSLYGSYGHSMTRPWGVDGGAPGSVNYIEIRPLRGAPLRLARTPARRLTRGDRVSFVTGGGGGWGRAAGRTRERVLSDVRDGYLTPDQVAEHYHASAR
jgi:N-methylhydantoinase B